MSSIVITSTNVHKAPFFSDNSYRFIILIFIIYQDLHIYKNVA